MIKKQLKHKIISTVFLATLFTNTLIGAVSEKIPVYAASVYDGVYSNLLSKPGTANGPMQKEDRSKYNDSTVFPNKYKLTESDYFGELTYSSSVWNGVDWGPINSKTHTETKSSTITGEKSILPNGEFKIRTDGSDNKSGVPLNWTLKGNGSIWRGVTNGFGYTSIAVVSADTSAAYLESSPMSTSGNTSYTLETDWAQEVGVKAATTQILYYNSSGVQISTTQLFDTRATGKVGGTTKVRGVFTTPANTSYMIIRLINWGRDADYSGAWWGNISVVPGNLFSIYSAQFADNISVSSGGYSGTIGKKTNGISWTENHGETNRRSPVLYTKESTYVTSNFLDKEAAIPKTKTTTYKDPVTDKVYTVTLNYTTGTAVFTGNRTFYQVNGPNGRAGYAQSSSGGVYEMPSSGWTTDYSYGHTGSAGYYNQTKIYRGYEQRGYGSDFDENNLLTYYGVSGKTQAEIGGAGATPQLAWYSGNSTYYHTAASGNIRYEYSNPPRLNNDTGYGGYGAIFDGLRNVVKYNNRFYRVLRYTNNGGSLSRYQDSSGTISTTVVGMSSLNYLPFQPTGSGSRTDTDANTNSYLETGMDVFDYGMVMTYNGWSTTLPGVRAVATDAQKYSVNESGSYRRFAHATYTKTASKEVSGDYSGSVALDDIAAGTNTLNQVYEGTIYQNGYQNYEATPSYAGTLYQRLKARLDNYAVTPTYKKYDTIYLNDIQTYDNNITRIRVRVKNQAGTTLNGMDTYINTPHSNPTTYHKRWPVQELVLSELIPDTPSGQNYYVEVSSYNGATQVKTMNLPFRLQTAFTIDQPTISSKFLYVGESYTINVSGPRHTDKIDIFFPFAHIAPNGTEITANSWVTIPRANLPYNSVTGKRTGSYTFTVSENQPASNMLFDMEVRGTSITDNYTHSMYLTNIHLRTLRIIGLEMKTVKWTPSEIRNINLKGPVASPIHVKTGYINTLQVEHRNAGRLELEFFVGNTPVNDIEFNTTSGTMVRYSGTLLNSTSAVINGENPNDHKITVAVSNPAYRYVDISFILPQVFRDSNIGNIISVKIKAYDEYGYVINNTYGDKFMLIVGSEKKDREDPNNIR